MPSNIVIILRAAFSFLALLAVCRLVGKKFDVVVPVVLGSLAAVLSLDRNIRMSDGLITFATWSVLAVLIGWLCIQSTQVRNIVNGKPTVIIEEGKILEKNLRKVRMTASDMMALLREKDAFKLTDVEFAVLESDGQISVMKKSDSQPVTPSTAGIAVQNEKAPIIAIQDDMVMKRTLEENGYSVGWLFKEIQKRGANDYGDVFLAQVDGKDNVYVDLKPDTLKKSPNDPSVKSRRLVLASLKKIQADLENFAIETNNQSAKTGYEEGAVLLKKLIEQVRSQLEK